MNKVEQTFVKPAKTVGVTTMKKTASSLIRNAAICCAAISSVALSQTDTASPSVASTRTGYLPTNITGITAEVKPLPTLLSVVPGVGILSAGVEGFVQPNIAIFTEAAAMSSNLPDRLRGATKDRLGNDKLYANKMRGGSIDVGARYYNTPMRSSWYTGGKVGYKAASAEWEYNDEVLEQETATITPGINAGYRWKWDSNFIVRLGAGATANLVQKQRVKSDRDNEDVKDARDQLDEAVKTPVLANIDLGLGYMF
jgi:hypothetical protein